MQQSPRLSSRRDNAERAKAEGTSVPFRVQACASATCLTALDSHDTRRVLMRAASTLETLGHQARADWLDLMAETLFLSLRGEGKMPWRLLDAGRVSSAAKQLQRHAPHYADQVKDLQAVADKIATCVLGFPVELHSFSGIDA